MKSLVGTDRPYILKGFEVLSPGDSIGTQSVSIKVADSVVYFPESTTGSFFHGLEEGNANSSPLIPELRKNATNFVFLTLTTFDTAQDTRALWDPDKEGGEGGEFTQEINTESVLKVDVAVSVGSFPEDTVPICIVKVGPSVIESIEDARDMMFRLGSGGLNPNPLSRYDFKSLPSASFQRVETPTVITSVSDPNPFQGADKNVLSLKEWMDLVMTKLTELGGTTFWYEDASAFSLISLWTDALGTTIKSKGQWQHSNATAGLIEWTEDLLIQSIIGPRDVIVRAGSKSISEDEVMFIDLIREEPINDFGFKPDFVNGVNFLDGVVGTFSNLGKGDYVKKDSDTDSLWLRVEEFFAGTGLGGGVTTAALAQSIQLVENYPGSSSTSAAVFTKGVYTVAEVSVADRQDASLNVAGGNMYWLALRSDTVMSMSDITTTSLVGNITDADGERAKFTSAGHGLTDGEQITITGTAAYNGTVTVEVIDSDIIFFETAGTGDEAATAFYAIATTTTTDNGFGLQLESANHNFENNITIIIAGTASSFDGDRVIHDRSDTTFSFAVGSNIANVSTGTATLARLNVRSESGIDRVIRGEIRHIGGADTEAIQQYIGQDNPAQTRPEYKISSGYNALDGHQNFNSSLTDDLRDRVSKLTAMMADRVQDRGIEIVGNSPITLSNTTTGGGQQITGVAELKIIKPGSLEQTVTVTSVLPVNSVAVITIDRNGGAPLTTTIESLDSSYLLEENKIILFYRLGGQEVIIWNGNVIAPNGTYTIGQSETSQNKNVIAPNRNTILNTGTGEVTFTSTTNMEIIIHGSTNNNIVDTSAINGTGQFILADGSSAWIRINRQVSKTINIVQTSDVPDTDVAGALYITTAANVPTDQDVFVLFTRIDDQILQVNTGKISTSNVYDEPLLVVAGAPADDNEITGPIVASTTFSIPLDSRNSNSVQKYINGAGFLEVYLNGQYLKLDEDWEETGSVGDDVSTITILQDLVIGDCFIFRIDTDGGIFFSSGGGGVTLQDAYDGNRTIATNLNQPVVINGAGGTKLLEINGNMKVTGVIDPKGMVFDLQASDPLQPTDNGLFVDLNGDLIQRRGVSSDVNITQGATGQFSASQIETTFDNNSGGNIAQAVPVRIDSNGDIDTVDVSVESEADSVIGLVKDSIINDGNSGQVATDGRLKNISTSAVFGDAIYIDKAGALTNVKPSDGVAGFTTGDFVVKVGVIAKNRDNPLNKDIIINVKTVGQI